MSVWLYIRLIIGVLFLISSVVFFILEVMGVFRMKYVLNRMHSAAIGDAMALGLAIIGLVILNGINFTSLKLILIPCFMFLSSPVSSHLIARMEVETGNNDDKFRKTNVRELDSLETEDGNDTV